MIHAIWVIALFTLLPVTITGATIQLSTSTELSSKYTFRQLTVETLPMSSDVARIEETGTPDYFSPFAFMFPGIHLPAHWDITSASLTLNHSLAYGNGNDVKTSQPVQEQCQTETRESELCPFTPDEFWGVQAVSAMFVDGFGVVGPYEPLTIDLLALGLTESLRNGTPLQLSGSVIGTLSSGDWFPSGFNSLSHYTIKGLTTGSVQASLFIELRHNPEPATFALAGGALLMIVCLRRRHRRANP